MENFKGFYKKNIQERREILSNNTSQALDFNETLKEKVYDKMTENAITTYEIPMGIVTQFPLNGHFYNIPMVTEEPSVIAAANNAAKILRENNGVKAHVISRIMRGEIIYSNPTPEFVKAINQDLDHLIEIANLQHPSIVKRGGGVTKLTTRIIEANEGNFFIIDVFVDTKEAMGANIINTILEGLSQELTIRYKAHATMSILSNLSTEATVYAQCQIDPSKLKNSKEIIDKFVTASQLASADPYRAATHNKGIMNGIDALVIASGNDWRATEAAMHAFAVKDGQYRGLTNWYEDSGFLIGEIEIPVPIGTVGGTISVHPKAKLVHNILNNPDAEELMMIIASLGLAQNFAALYALVTDGIQKGHMRLHARTLAIQAGANDENISFVVSQLIKQEHINLENAKQIIKDYKPSN